MTFSADHIQTDGDNVITGHFPNQIENSSRQVPGGEALNNVVTLFPAVEDHVTSTAASLDLLNIHADGSVVDTMKPWDASQMLAELDRQFRV